MQGFSKVDEKPKSPAVMEMRKRLVKDAHRDSRALRPHKRRLKERFKEGRDWPMAVDPSGMLIERADLEKDEVLAPLPDDMKGNVDTGPDEKMRKLRDEADQHHAFTAEADETLVLKRRREHQERMEAAEALRGTTWTPEMVEARLEEAFKTLFRSSVNNVRPREFGNAMPSIIREVSDMVHQAGNKSLRNAIAHRFKGVPSAEEMERADDALAWAARFLNDQHPDYAGFAQLGAMWKVYGHKISQRCKAIGVHRQVFYRDRKEAIRLIVEGLKKEGKAPT